MEVETPKDFFEKILPERFDASKAAGIDVTVQVSITGTNGGDWIVTIKEQKLYVKEGIEDKSDLALKMTEKDYLDLINHKISAEKAFFTGKVHFKGNIALALRLREAGFL
jgi:putative sterol carrier protein